MTKGKKVAINLEKEHVMYGLSKCITRNKEKGGKSN